MSKINTDALSIYPYFLRGAFASQAYNINKSKDLQHKKIACYVAAVSAYIKRQQAKCFCSYDTLLSQYNDLAAQFGLKNIKRSTFALIQQLAIGIGIVSKSNSEFCRTTGKKYRQLVIDHTILAQLFPAVAKLANLRAQQLQHRKKSDCNRDDDQNHAKALQHIASRLVDQSKNRTIITKQSNDLIYKNKRIPDATFYKQKFGEDADAAYQLQKLARDGAIKPAAAKKLLALHHRHQVPCGIKKYLDYVVLSKGFVAAQHTYNPNFDRSESVSSSHAELEHYRDERGRWHVK